jgi:CMP-N,N'-diacetyllegionaminic acid synthase
MSEGSREYYAVIPARGGSKGIPRKPLVDLAGRPLLAHSVEAAARASRISATFVSTEDQEIADVAAKCGARVISRPPALSQDHVSMDPVLLHAIEAIRVLGEWEVEERGWVVLLQPTSPLRRAEDIDDAIRALEESGGLGLVSVTEVDREVYKLMAVGEDGFLRGMVSPQAPFMRRQDCPTVVRPNGAIYIYKASAFLEAGGFFFQGVIPFLMDPDRSLDIDSPEELATAEEYLSP